MQRDIECRGGPFDQPEGERNTITVDALGRNRLPEVYQSVLRTRGPDGVDGPPMLHTYLLRTDEDTPYYAYDGAVPYTVADPPPPGG